MALTKYVPKNFFGGPAPTTLDVVFTPEPGMEYVLTEIIATNGTAALADLSVAWRKNSTDVYLMHSVKMPANSAVNLNLYLPLDETNLVKAEADSGVSLTLNGLTLVEV